MPIRNMPFDTNVKPGVPLMGPAFYSGCLDPDLAVGPGRFNRCGQATGSSLIPDQPISTTRPVVRAMEPAACRLSGIHSMIEPVFGLA
jgi:hypothetical protein